LILFTQQTNKQSYIGSDDSGGDDSGGDDIAILCLQVVDRIAGDKYHVLHFWVRPCDSGYGANSRLRQVFVLLLRKRVKIIQDMGLIYSRISEVLSEVQLKPSSVWLEMTDGEIRHELKCSAQTGRGMQAE